MGYGDLRQHSNRQLRQVPHVQLPGGGERRAPRNMASSTAMLVVRTDAAAVAALAPSEALQSIGAPPSPPRHDPPCRACECRSAAAPFLAWHGSDGLRLCRHRRSASRHRPCPLSAAAAQPLPARSCGRAAASRTQGGHPLCSESSRPGLMSTPTLSSPLTAAPPLRGPIPPEGRAIVRTRADHRFPPLVAAPRADELGRRCDFGRRCWGSLPTPHSLAPYLPGVAVRTPASASTEMRFLTMRVPTTNRPDRREASRM